MSVVKINAIEVPEDHRAELEKRFASRAGLVESSPGFEGFELLRPTSGETRYFVYTRWADEASYEAWVGSQSFAAGHAREGAPSGEEAASQRPVATGSSLLGFEVVLKI